MKTPLNSSEDNQKIMQIIAENRLIVKVRGLPPSPGGMTAIEAMIGRNNSADIAKREAPDTSLTSLLRPDYGGRQLMTSLPLILNIRHKAE